MNIKSITLVLIIVALICSNVWFYVQIGYHKDILALTTNYIDMLHQAKILPTANEVYQKLNGEIKK